MPKTQTISNRNHQKTTTRTRYLASHYKQHPNIPNKMEMENNLKGKTCTAQDMIETIFNTKPLTRLIISVIQFDSHFNHVHHLLIYEYAKWRSIVQWGRGWVLVGNWDGIDYGNDIKARQKYIVNKYITKS